TYPVPPEVRFDTNCLCVAGFKSPREGTMMEIVSMMNARGVGHFIAAQPSDIRLKLLPEFTRLGVS
ncbi:hypothetical protein LCGC14_0626180, partial [marine sediment metagenome]